MRNSTYDNTAECCGSTVPGEPGLLQIVSRNTEAIKDIEARVSDLAFRICGIPSSNIASSEKCVSNNGESIYDIVNEQRRILQSSLEYLIQINEGIYR